MRLLHLSLMASTPFGEVIVTRVASGIFSPASEGLKLTLVR